MTINYDEDIIYEIDVDIHNKNKFESVYTKQYDENSRWIIASLYDNGSEYTIPVNTIAYFSATKPDNTGIFNECQIVDNKILYPISLQTTIKDGKFDAEFRLYKTIDSGDGATTNKLLSTPKFIMHVEKSALDDNTVISSNDFIVFTDAMNSVGDLTADVNDAISRANTVILEAETATTNANTATTNANNAADLANTNAGLAETATADANTATDNANTATSNANTAILNAETATINANNSASNANDKASLADTASTKANNIATLLETETLKIFKDSVDTYAEIATTYPNPEIGWTVTVNGESPVTSYRYNGSEWVNLGAISSVETATNTTLGIVKGGGNINIGVDGTLNAPTIGDLTLLSTTSNTDLVSAINETFQSVSDGIDLTNYYTKTDVDNAIGEVESQLEDISTELLDYSSYVSVKENDVYTVVDFKRSDATLYLKSTLSNADENGYYQTCTLNYYDSLGTTIIKTVIWTFTYDIDGKIVTKVVA